MKRAYFNDLLRLRLLVGFLGERAQFGWWSTSFFDPSGALFLEPAFPKTSRLAQYHGALAAARHLHDEHIGVGNVFHLFRLPEEVEHTLHSLLLDRMIGSNVLPDMQSHQAAVSALASITEGQTRAAAEGPIAAGKLSDLSKPGVLRGIAGSYLAAFEGGFKTYPYFKG